MKLQFRIFGLFASWLIFAGCPYESNVPIDAPSVKINPNLLGTWEDRENKNDEYHISKQDEFTYHIVVTERDKDEHEIYHAYASDVKGVMFLNIFKSTPGDTSATCLLYKMEMENDHSITLSEVTDNIDEKFSSSGELKKFIGANMKNSYFFGKEVTYLVRPGM